MMPSDQIQSKSFDDSYRMDSEVKQEAATETVPELGNQDIVTATILAILIGCWVVFLVMYPNVSDVSSTVISHLSNVVKTASNLH